MLSALTRKLCPLMTLAIATVGCGKKISDSKNVPAQQTENQVIPSLYITRLDGSETSIKNYKVPKPANFFIPDRLKVRKGSTKNKIVDIGYAVNEYDSDDFLIKCSYVASSDPSQMVVSKCITFNGNHYSSIDLESMFTIREGQIIQMRFTGASSSDMVVEAIMDMQWE